MWKQFNNNDMLLMQGFRAGREDCFTIVFKRLYEALCMYGYRIAGEKAVAEDMAENALLVVWERRGQFQEFLSLRHYCYTTVRNGCFSWLRKQQMIKQPALDTELIEDAESNRLQDIIRAETYRELHQAIELLPAQCRQVLKLSYLEGMTIKQVSAALNMKAGTVKSQRNRGILLLRKRLLSIFFVSCLLKFLSLYAELK
jgi:RNA polymerase sigma-70 factor (ECF subfamily)